jgi:hypothetical protein
MKRGTKFAGAQIPREMLAKLHARATAEGVSLADVMRRAMTAFIEAKPLEERVADLEIRVERLEKRVG